MKRVDMHIHTNVSDGTWSVGELKDELLKKNISIFSITDHDDIGNVLAMEKIIYPQDSFNYIKGVEITTTYNNKEYHLTLYNYDIKNNRLLSFLDWTKKHRLNFNDKFIKYMSNIYENVSFNDFLVYKEDRSRGAWKSLNYLIDKGVHKNMFEHFSDIKKSGLTIEFKSPEEVMNICKKSGGFVFLAHPSYHYRNDGMCEEELRFWLELGIDGIECYSPYNKNNHTSRYISFCKNNNIMISTGSDCHGTLIKERRLGYPNVYLNDINISKLL